MEGLLREGNEAELRNDAELCSVSPSSLECRERLSSAISIAENNCRGLIG